MNLYEIKIGKKYIVVKANSFLEVANFCEIKGYKDCRICGMMSIGELDYYKNNAPTLGELKNG